MKRFSFFLILFICTLSVNAQTKKSTCKIAREVNTNQPQAKLIIKFLGPTKQPAKSRVKMVINNDTITPVINEKGIYLYKVEPGNYELKFMVPYWSEASIKKLICRQNDIISITVYFEAEEIGTK